MASYNDYKKVKGTKKEPKQTMSLGPLKGVFQERKSRLDAEINSQTGAKPKKKAKKKV